MSIKKDTIPQIVYKSEFSYCLNNDYHYNDLAHCYPNWMNSTSCDSPFKHKQSTSSTLSIMNPFLFPKEMDIFENVPNKVFEKSNNEQMAALMSIFKEQYTRYVAQDNSFSCKHRLQYNIDDDGVQSVQMLSIWNRGKAMLYFSFEPDPTESSFGFIWEDNEKKNYQSRSGNISCNDYYDIIRETIDFIFRAYS